MIDLTAEKPIGVDQVARMLDVSPRTVRVWTNPASSPRLETIKIGGRLYTSVEAIQRFGEQREAAKVETQIVDTVERVLESRSDKIMQELLARHGGKRYARRQQEAKAKTQTA